MRILFVASRFPYPPIQGDRVRSYYLLPHLRARHEITLVTPVSGPPTREQEAVARELSHHWYPVVVSRWHRG
ncbi:MAG: sugar transferase, partial [Chloroflexi bacterium]|nr:sugar transferase [Chloroflexota bacterium]